MNPNSRFHALLSKWVDADINSEEVMELSEILERDPSARVSFTDHLLLDSMLSDELGQESLTSLVDLVAESGAASSSESSRIGLQNIPSSTWKPQQGHWLRTVCGMVAAAILAFLVFGWFFPSEQAVFAGADRVVEAAMQTHSEPIERVYIVQLERGEDPLQAVDLPRDVRVSTQGDRFWVSMNGKRQWAWGRDSQGAVWMTLGTDRAVIVGPEEIGLPLRYIGDLYTLNLETMLKSFLKYCRLDRTLSPGGADIITATTRPLWKGRPLKRAIIEVDRESKAIRKLVLERQFPNQELCVITFTLVESRIAVDSMYGPQGHLTEPYRIHTQSSDIRERYQMVLDWFGPNSERWIVAGRKATK